MVWWLAVLMVNPDEKWLNPAGEVGGSRAIASHPPHTHTAFPWPHRTCWAHGGLFQGLGHPVGGDRRRGRWEGEFLSLAPTLPRTILGDSKVGTKGQKVVNLIKPHEAWS